MVSIISNRPRSADGIVGSLPPFLGSTILIAYFEVFTHTLFISGISDPIFRVVIKYSHSHLSSHPSSHLKMPTKIEINKILTPSNCCFYKELTPDLKFSNKILTPGCFWNEFSSCRNTLFEYVFALSSKVCLQFSKA